MFYCVFIIKHFYILLNNFCFIIIKHFITFLYYQVHYGVFINKLYYHIKEQITRYNKKPYSA